MIGTLQPTYFADPQAEATFPKPQQKKNFPKKPKDSMNKIANNYHQPADPRSNLNPLFERENIRKKPSENGKHRADSFPGTSQPRETSEDYTIKKKAKCELSIHDPNHPLNRKGNWTCPNTACNNINFFYRKKCNLCATPRPQPQKNSENEQPQSNVWTCSNCRASNFVQRDTCIQCNAPKISENNQLAASTKKPKISNQQILNIFRDATNQMKNKENIPRQNIGDKQKPVGGWINAESDQKTKEPKYYEVI